MPDDKDFTKEPYSITELRANKTGAARDWTPRDCLVDMLRQIDSGELNPDAIVVVYRVDRGENQTGIGSVKATPDLHVALQMLDCAKLDLWYAGSSSRD
jgi:DNA invertase Pin-like site-specific DNA recombinase